MSKFLLVFDPVGPLWIIVPLLLIMTGVFAWLEIKRKSTAKIYRLIALTLMMVALCGILLRPSYPREVISNATMVLTTGYNKETADSLVAAVSDLSVIRIIGAADYTADEWSISPERLGDLSQVRFVLGEGLSDSQLDRSAETQFTYFPAPVPNGIVDLQWNTFRVNRKNHLKGVFNNLSNARSLKLIGPGGPEDSVTLQKKGLIPFDLEFNPRKEGRFIYFIATTDSTGNSSTESLPIEIIPERKLKVLIMSTFPTFEIRYLKNFLVSKGHGLVIRYQVSKNLYRYEYANHQNIKIDRLSTDLLNEFDLLFIPENTLDNLSRQELRELNEAIQDGLGIIFIMDKIPEGKALNSFLDVQPAKRSSDSVKVQFSDPGILSMISPPIKVSGDDLQSITKTIDGQILSGYRFKGMGKVGFQLLGETFSLSLQGHHEAYADLWSPLTERTARTLPSTYKIRVPKPFPLSADQPIAVEVISARDQPTLLADGVPVPLIEDAVVDDLWKGKIWSSGKGWHQLMIAQDSTTLNLYTAGNSDWSAMNVSHQMSTNKTSQGIWAGEGIAKTEFTAISPFIFFILFLLTAGYLWIEPRI